MHPSTSAEAVPPFFPVLLQPSTFAIPKMHTPSRGLERGEGGGGLTNLLNNWHLKGFGAISARNYFGSCITIDKYPLDIALDGCCHYQLGSGWLLLFSGGL